MYVCFGAVSTGSSIVCVVGYRIINSACVLMVQATIMHVQLVQSSMVYICWYRVINNVYCWYMVVNNAFLLVQSVYLLVWVCVDTDHH